MDASALEQLVALFGILIGTLALCKVFRLPSLLGFFVGGMIAGPNGLGLVGESLKVASLAEIGVALLLFTIGMEFSQETISRLQRAMLLGGSIQIAGTTGVVVALGHMAGLAMEKAIFAGMLVSLSSTAIVVRSLEESAKLQSPQGQSALGILIFQDLMIVPMMLAIPVLGASGGSSWDTGAAMRALMGLVIMSAAAGLGWKLIPGAFFLIARARSREMFLLALLALCFFMTWLAHSQGLSPAIGALLAGILISRSDFAHEALGNVLPFRDVFMSFFFASIGMMLDMRFLLANPVWIGIGALGLILIKAVVATVAGMVLRLPIRVAVGMGFGLGQIGELSFILAQSGLVEDLISQSAYQVFLAISVLTMAATPMLLASGERLGKVMASWPWLPSWAVERAGSRIGERESLHGHLVIVGFGLNGRNLAKAAKAVGIPYVIVEMNPKTVKEEKRKGEPIIFGDASHEAVLKEAGIHNARTIVIAINDPGALRSTVLLARKLNPGVHIIARTRYIQEVDPLYALGADHVIPEEFETSIEIFTRVLRNYLVPEQEVEKLVGEIRSEGYEMLRRPFAGDSTLCQLGDMLGDVEVRALRVQDGSEVVEKTLSELALRRDYGVTVVALKRGSEWKVPPDAQEPIRAGDVLLVLARAEGVAKIRRLLCHKEESCWDTGA